MKHILWAIVGFVIAVCLMAFTHTCYAAGYSGSPSSAGHGHRGGPRRGPATSASAQTGQGKPWGVQAVEYDPNSVDRFQPWPQSEMRKYQKP